MKKDGAISDVDRRRNHVSKLQDGEGWRKRKELPPADATWPTCLIIAPSTVVHNWERELQTVINTLQCDMAYSKHLCLSGDISKWECTTATQKSANVSSLISKWDALICVRVHHTLPYQANLHTQL